MWETECNHLVKTFGSRCWTMWFLHERIINKCYREDVMPINNLLMMVRKWNFMTLLFGRIAHIYNKWWYFIPDSQYFGREISWKDHGHKWAHSDFAYIYKWWYFTPDSQSFGRSYCRCCWKGKPPYMSITDGQRSGFGGFRSSGDLQGPQGEPGVCGIKCRRTFERVGLHVWKQQWRGGRGDLRDGCFYNNNMLYWKGSTFDHNTQFSCL